MSNVIKSIYNGQCTYLNKTNSISIDYLEVPMCGTTQLRYKKTDYSCSEKDECPFPSKDK